jgi:hypothetical protein
MREGHANRDHAEMNYASSPHPTMSSQQCRRRSLRVGATILGAALIGLMGAGTARAIVPPPSMTGTASISCRTGTPVLTVSGQLPSESVSQVVSQPSEVTEFASGTPGSWFIVDPDFDTTYTVTATANVNGQGFTESVSIKTPSAPPCRPEGTTDVMLDCGDGVGAINFSFPVIPDTSFIVGLVSNGALATETTANLGTFGPLAPGDYTVVASYQFSGPISGVIVPDIPVRITLSSCVPPTTTDPDSPPPTTTDPDSPPPTTTDPDSPPPTTTDPDSPPPTATTTTTLPDAPSLTTTTTTTTTTLVVAVLPDVPPVPSTATPPVPLPDPVLGSSLPRTGSGGGGLALASIGAFLVIAGALTLRLSRRDAA